MLEIAIMIEGQDGLTWPRWQRLARTVEELGFVGLYRSDHYTNAGPPDKDSLELWVSLTWLASHTERIEFGPLVSPLSFREPTMLARMAAAVDDLSGGRLTLGVGAGWQEREHAMFGWDLLPVSERMDRFEEGLAILTGLLRDEERVTVEGEYYQVHEAILLPRPQRPSGPPIAIGGNGPKRTLPLAAEYADAWNGVYLTPTQFADLNSRLDELLVANGRQPEEMRRSLMVGTIFAQTEAALEQKVANWGGSGRTAEEWQESGHVVGTPARIAEQLAAYEEAGVQRVMLQWLEQDDLAGLTALAEAVL